MTTIEQTEIIPSDAKLIISPSCIWFRHNEATTAFAFSNDADIIPKSLNTTELGWLELISDNYSLYEIANKTNTDLITLRDFLRRLEAWAPNIITWQLPDLEAAEKLHDQTIEAARLHDIWLAISSTPDENAIFHREVLSDAQRQFDSVETTISHYFREPHEALLGRSYGAAFCDWLVKEGKLRIGDEVLEVGCGLGFFAKALLDHLESTYPDIYNGIRYTMFDLSEELQAAQKINCRSHSDIIGFNLGNIETHNFGAKKFDLVISNEVIADFSVATVSINNIENGTPQTLAEKIAYDFNLDCIHINHGRERKAVINLGAIQFLQTIRHCLNEQGHAVITEYGTMNMSPKAVTFENHLEFSVQFSQLQQVTNQLGFKTEILNMGSVLNFDRQCEILDFDSFNALAKCLLPYFGRSLPTMAHTRDGLKELIGELIPKIGNLRFLSLDDPRAFSPFRFELMSLNLPKSDIR